MGIVFPYSLRIARQIRDSIARIKGIGRVLEHIMLSVAKLWFLGRSLSDMIAQIFWKPIEHGH